MAHSETELFDLVTRSNVNAAWGGLTMEVLARLGVETVVTSPGSRSTPLTVAAARNPRIEALSILDERSAAFYALGLAKRTHRPVGLVCTSGSAAANYWPAIVEASMSGTPLIIMTADRPPELRDCASGQTIDQLKLYGGYVRHFAELALPELTEPMLAYLRQSLVHAIHLTLGVDPGPVHLNFPFRDPLAPEIVNPRPIVDAATMERAATVTTRPCESVAIGFGGSGCSGGSGCGDLDLVALERMSSHGKGIIVVGAENPRCGDEAFADAVAMIANKLGWPVLADVLNPLRNHAGESPALITRYDTFLRDAVLADDLPATAILQIGSLPTSKVLRGWLGSLDAVSFLLSSRPTNTDPLHRIATPLYGEAPALAGHLQHQSVDAEWAARWSAIERRTAGAIDEHLSAVEGLFEGKVAWQLSQYLPVGTPVFLASSMSVRYAEYFWVAGSRAHSIYCNRGANGIDGTLSTALGVAHRAEPAVLLTGDLAFLHDSNGLLAASQLKGCLTVILINNKGGGIFEHLSVAQMEPPFEDYFATPQAVNIAKLCEAHSVPHQIIDSWASFADEISCLSKPGVRVLELVTDRKADRALLIKLLDLSQRH